LVLSTLLCATTLVGTSGIYLFFLPNGPRWAFLLIIRTHIYGSWTMVAALFLHVFAGLGILRTHRGLLRTMFGDGTPPVRTARTLWPAWTNATLPTAK
jgi:hypothetical protein